MNCKLKYDKKCNGVVIGIIGNGRNKRYVVKWPNDQVEKLTIRALEVVNEDNQSHEIVSETKDSHLEQSDNSDIESSDNSNILDSVDEKKE